MITQAFADSPFEVPRTFRFGAVALACGGNPKMCCGQETRVQLERFSRGGPTLQSQAATKPKRRAKKPRPAPRKQSCALQGQNPFYFWLIGSRFFVGLSVGVSPCVTVCPLFSIGLVPAHLRESISWLSLCVHHIPQRARASQVMCRSRPGGTIL